MAENGLQDWGLNLLAQLTEGSASGVALPLRELIQKMLSMYSHAVLVLAGFIVLYYVILTIVDAAQTGKVFRRINPVWGPVRLIIAIGLLVPLVSGLNSGQLMAIKMAEWGSGLASRMWSLAVADSATMRPMIAEPTPVPAIALVRALILRDACISYTSILAREASAHRAATGNSDVSPTAKPLPTGSLKIVTAQPETANAEGSVTIPYGWREQPYFCGAVTTYRVNVDKDQPLFAMLKQAHLDALRTIEPFTAHYAADYLALARGEEPQNRVSPAALAERYEEVMQLALGTVFKGVLDKQLDELRLKLGQNGWVGAPAYLDTLLRLNVRLLGLNASLPQVDPPELLLSPPLMTGNNGTFTAEQKVYLLLRTIDNSWGDTPQISPLSAGGLGGISTLLSHAVTLSREVGGSGATGHQLRSARDMMRTNDYNWAKFATKNPLVGVADLGAYLSGKAMAILAGAGVLNNVSPVTAPTVWMLALLGIIAFLASTALLLLLPFMPLVRFMLGVAVWLVEVLEALIAMPLVALAHLRADENGLAGKSAVLCYLMILKVVLRPVLMVLGLMGGLVILLLMVALLNPMLSAIMPSISDSGQIASLWFVLISAVYALLVLAVANAAFKLIDWLPARVLDWLAGFANRGQPYMAGDRPAE